MSQIALYAAGSRGVRFWSADGTIAAEFQRGLTPLTFGPRGVIAFNWVGPAHRRRNVDMFSSEDGIRLLNTAAAGSSVISPPTPASWPSAGPIVAHSPGVPPAASSPAPAPSNWNTVAQFSASTGRELRLYHLGGHQAYSVVWSNSSGSVIVVNVSASLHSEPFEGVIAGDRFARVPGSAGPFIERGNPRVAF